MAEPSSSYFNVLDLLLQQLRGEQPYQVIEGNMHGAVYPISLAYLGNIFGQTESYVICYYVQGGILALMVMLTTLFMGNLTGRFWIGVIAAVSICCFSYPYWIATLGYSYWGAPVTWRKVPPLVQFCLNMPRKTLFPATTQSRFLLSFFESLLILPSYGSPFFFLSKNHVL